MRRDLRVGALCFGLTPVVAPSCARPQDTRHLPFLGFHGESGFIWLTSTSPLLPASSSCVVCGRLCVVVVVLLPSRNHLGSMAQARPRAGPVCGAHVGQHQAAQALG